jgi:hypothetical protein
MSVAMNRVVLLIVLVMAFGFRAAADVLGAWDVNGVDVATGLNIDGAVPAYNMNATTMGLHIQAGELSLGFNAPSAASDMYGFKISDGIHTSSLEGAIAADHFIQFTLFAESGYRFDLTSIEMNGTSGSSGPDDIALLSDVDGFAEGSAIQSLTGRQNLTGGWDTDASGWGDDIALEDIQYQDITSVTFRIYGWNDTGTASAGIRDLSGDDLVINGSIEAIPEPAVIGFVALTGIGALVAKRFFE